MGDKTYETINFSEDDTSAQGLVTRLDLDDEKNGGTTVFYPAVPAYVRYFPGSYDVPYTFETTKGEVLRETTKLPFEIIDEVVSFINSDSGYLDYVPEGAVSWAWDGAVGPDPVFDGSKIVLPAQTAGILKCSYTTLFDRLKVSCNEGAEVLLVCVNQGRTNSLTITFDEDATSGGPKEVVVHVKNYCTDNDVPGAQVEVTGPGIAFSGLTGADGKVNAGTGYVGAHYTLKVTKAGFKDSDLDSLNNDGFTIS